MPDHPFPLDAAELTRLVKQALAEDRADRDVTTAALVPPDQRGRATISTKQDGVLAGLPVAEAAFAAIDPSLLWQPERTDGDRITPGDLIVAIEGSVASILRAERVALNFLSHLSGVATAASAVVAAVEGTGCRLRDTRKTIPGLRLLQKYAARMGGADNHRLDLSDGVLIKDNHLAAVRARGLGIPDAVRLARDANPGVRIEIEVTSAEEAAQALDAGADELLLDNMTPEQMRDVVTLAASSHHPITLEASGGITLENAREIAGTGVHYMSIGTITHSARALDMSLELEAGPLS